ncbi:MAG: tripartite tricarboxylate transporter TctB family protein [Rhodospirillales bacterium]|jgi:putative tricarboxylic transport membrane protein|nr:tripartite tricarboxylate transporter TctB family protein [Rhodospirillales bacterium]
MRFNDAITGLVLLLFGAAVTIHSQLNFPGLPGQNYGPAFFPTIIGVGLAGCGVILIIQGILKRHEVPLVVVGEWARSPRHRTNLALILASLLFYILVVDFLGFVITSLAITVLMMVRFGVRPLNALFMATGSTLIIHTFFYKFLLVPLPWGITQAIAW